MGGCTVQPYELGEQTRPHLDCWSDPGDDTGKYPLIWGWSGRRLLEKPAIWSEMVQTGWENEPPSSLLLYSHRNSSLSFLKTLFFFFSHNLRNIPSLLYNCSAHCMGFKSNINMSLFKNFVSLSNRKTALFIYFVNKSH